MKKLALLLVATLSFNLSSCLKKQESVTQDVKAEVKVEEAQAVQELRGVWLSFYEISDICKGKTEEEYRKNAEEVIKKVSEKKLNTIFYQVRCFSDALYKSEVFPSSRYVAENEGDELSYDPFGIFIETATKYNIDVHAWVNPFRISYETKISDLCKTNPARILYNGDEDLSGLIICEKGIYYNPADDGARKIILDGIRELIENYDVKGIQFDDYFYPECDDINDGINYNIYKENKGDLTLEEWRKANVSSLISSVYALVKSSSKSLVFGVSPSASFSKNESFYADVKKWCAEEGYVDYIMPQIYYGFENENAPFNEVLDEWCSLERNEQVKLYVGLAAYKVNEEDKNAGSGKKEWVENPDVLIRQYNVLKNKTDGFAVFSYSYL